jgi:hypothetical protein
MRGGTCANFTALLIQTYGTAMLLSDVVPAWVVHVRTEARNSKLKAYIAIAKDPGDAIRLVRKHCKLASIKGVHVELLGRLTQDSASGFREAYGFEDGSVIEWPLKD